MHKVHEKMLATFEGFRRLGFSSEDIYAGWDGRPLMVLRTQGLEFVVDYRPVGAELKQGRFSKGWISAAHNWNGPMSEDERQRIYHEHMPTEAFVAIIMLLHEKGFLHPSGKTLLELYSVPKPVVADV